MLKFQKNWVRCVFHAPKSGKLVTTCDHQLRSCGSETISETVLESLCQRTLCPIHSGHILNWFVQNYGKNINQIRIFSGTMEDITFKFDWYAKCGTPDNETSYVVGGSDPIRTRENRVVKHHLISSLCVFSHCPQCFVEVEIKGWFRGGGAGVGGM